MNTLVPDLHHRPGNTLRPPRSRRGKESGFTLVELMVAMTVLVILCGLVMQLMGSATRLTGNARQAADCDAQARFVLSQISRDLAHRIRRPDVDAYVEPNKGNDRLFLYAEMPGYAPNISDPREVSPASLVGYRITQKTSAVQPSTFLLERCAIALPWRDGNAGLRALPFVALDRTRLPIPTTTLSGADGRGQNGTFEKVLNGDKAYQMYFQELASNVLRFEVAIILKPGIRPSDPRGAQLPPDAVAQLPARILTEAEINPELARYGWTRIASVVVSLAIIDSRSTAQTGFEELQKVAAALSDARPSAYPLLPVDLWNETFQSMSAGWPRPVVAGLRFYQKTIPLN